MIAKSKKIILATAVAGLVFSGISACTTAEEEDEEAVLETTDAKAADDVKANEAEPEAAAPEVDDVAPEVAAPAEAAQPMAVTPPALTPPISGNMSVHFVTNDGAKVFDQPPVSGGRQVGKKLKGDPVLAAIEGAWARLDNGQYMEATSLSDKPVPRSKTKSKWK